MGVLARLLLGVGIAFGGACTAIAGLDGDYTVGDGSGAAGGASMAAPASGTGNGGAQATTGPASGGMGGGPSSGGGGSSPECPPGAPGPKMLFVDHDGGDYCIDFTEVTSAHYKLFLDTGPSLAQLPAVCNWKTGFTPRASGNQCVAKHYDPVNLPNRPVACVDWCDAHAYCAWAGKRLCGRVGGGATPFDAIADADESEWFNACSDGAQLTFPYGNNYQPLTCVGDDYDGTSGDGASDDAIDVGAASGCAGGLSGLVDMSGNVLEWERSCDTNGGNDQANSCRDRGGSFWDAQGELRCQDAGPAHHTRSYYNKNIGFRCCADPAP